jgi:glucosamine-6-phosphate deaminase
MNLWRFDNANSLYYALISTLSEEVKTIVAEGRDPVFLLPTGNTMIPFYHLAIENQEKLQISKWKCFNLDEYYPLPEKNLSYSFEHFMNQHFYGKLAAPVTSRDQLDGTKLDPTAECARYEARLKEVGPVDLALLGIGTNGHVAFNEPHMEFNTRTRLVELHEETLMANFKGSAPAHSALTVGLGTILEARKIFILALGKNKATAVKCATQDIASRGCPASVLQTHPAVTWFLDQEASALT